MRKYFFIILASMLPNILFADPIEWQMEVLVKADYGDEADDYGYEGIEKSYQDTSPIGPIYMGQDYIFVGDRFQNNIKMYDFQGNLIRVVSLKRDQKKYLSRRGLPGRDILVHEGVIYLLSDGGGIPPEGESNVTVISFNIETGKQLSHLRIYNPAISRQDGDNSYTVGATRLRLGPNGGVWIYDSTHDESYPLVRDGEAVPMSEHAEGISGEIFESGRINYNEKTEDRELYDSAGNFIGIISPQGDSSSVYINARRHSKDGQYFLGSSGNPSKPAIMNWDGQVVGWRRTMNKESWAIYSSCSSYEFDYEGRLYRIYAENDGIYIYRWSNKLKN